MAFGIILSCHPKNREESYLTARDGRGALGKRSFGKVLLAIPREWEAHISPVLPAWFRQHAPPDVSPVFGTCAQAGSVVIYRSYASSGKEVPCITTGPQKYDTRCRAPVYDLHSNVPSTARRCHDGIFCHCGCLHNRRSDCSNQPPEYEERMSSSHLRRRHALLAVFTRVSSCSRDCYADLRRCDAAWHQLGQHVRCDSR